VTLSRRAWIGGAVAAGAAAAGAFAFHSRRRAQGPQPWGLTFDTPDGGRLALASLRGQPLLLNFWAPWCPPCVREMPLLDRFQRDFGATGWRVLGIAADNPEPVRAFLERSPVGFPIALAGFAGVELSREFGNTAGGLPFSIAFDARGDVSHRHIGELRYEQLASWATGIS
jgi:thiol-disulfide isomerase/thioredoxin